MLEYLSTSVLEEAYEKAKELELDEDFIKVLEKTLNERLVTIVN